MNPAPTKSFAAGALAVRVYSNQARLALDAAQIAGAYLRESIATQGSAAVVLASANSQLQFLAELIRQDGVDWSRVTCFHMDEYAGIAADHPASFRRFLREKIAGRLPLRAFHYIAGDAPQPLEECERYARLLHAQPVDLCCLGIGENGHLAFNDPPEADFADPRTVAIVKLAEPSRRQQVGEGHFASLDSVPREALTLTIPALCAARRMLCIVPEKRKAQAVKDALQGPVHAACPASILRQQPHATLFLDADSAGLL